MGEKTKTMFNPGDVITLPHYETAGGPMRKRVWKVGAVYLGATHQENVYALQTLDIENTDFGPMMLVLGQILESHPHILRV